jgi:transcription elongation factor GreA
MSDDASIERSLQDRLMQLEAQIPRLERAAAGGDHASFALLASARRQRTETIEVLEQARSLHSQPWDEHRIEVGDTIDLEELGGSAIERYVLAWETGARVSDGWISHTSPVGRALMGRRRGDVVNVDAPGGEVAYRIAGFRPSR